MKSPFSRIVLIFGMIFGTVSSSAFAQTAGQDMKKAGADTKDAAKSAAQGTGKAVKTGAAKTTHASKTVAHKAATKVDQGSKKVEDKTR